MVAAIGTVDPRQLAYASGVLAALPGSLREMAYEPFGARVVVYALLLDVERESVRGRPTPPPVGLCRPGGLPAGRDCRLPRSLRLPAESRLPLVSMAVPAIRRLSRDQFARFAACVDSLIQADGQVSLYEYALRRLVLRAAIRAVARPRAAVYDTPAPLAGAARQVLGTLATVGTADADDAARAYAAGVRSLGWPEVDETLPAGDLGPGVARPRTRRARRRRTRTEEADPRRLRLVHRRRRPDHARGRRPAPRHRRVARLSAAPAPVARPGRPRERSRRGLIVARFSSRIPVILPRLACRRDPFGPSSHD